MKRIGMNVKLLNDEKSNYISWTRRGMICNILFIDFDDLQFLFINSIIILSALWSDSSLSLIPLKS